MQLDTVEKNMDMNKIMKSDVKANGSENMKA